MTRREAGVPWIDVFKFVICKLNSKEDEAGSSSRRTMPLGWDAVMCFVAIVLHSWNQDLFLSLPLLHTCAYVHAHTNTHTALSPNLLQKGLFSRLLPRGHTFPGAAIV